MRRTIKFNVIGVLIFIILICLLSAYYASVLNNNLYKEKVEYLNEVNAKGATIIKSKVEDSFAEMNGVATFIADGYAAHPDRMMGLLLGVSNKSDFKRMGIITLDGMATMTDGYTIDFSQREYFKKALNGESNVSDVLIDKVDNKEIVVFAVPMINKGNINAVLFATRSLEDFSKLLEVQSFGGEGFSYVIKRNGTPIIDTDHKNSIGEYTNLFNALRRETESDKKIDEFERSIGLNEAGTVHYDRKGLALEASHTPIGVNDWQMISVVPTKAVFADSDRLIMLILAAGGLVFFAVLYLCMLLADFFTSNTKKLQAIAYTDPVTGYLNWNKFSLDGPLLLKKHVDKKYAMVLFDIDHFKVINDIYGHQRGNEILKNIADILKENVAENELFTRTSADNFNVLMVYEGEAEVVSRIKAISDKIADILPEYTISLSFGIYIISGDFPNVSTLSDRAAIARLKIKGKTDALYSFFDENSRKVLLTENEIESCMEASLKNGEFQMYLQPKFSFKTGKIVGAEALCRWHREGKGMLSPDSFIPLFERNGFIRKLDEYMFENVCSLLRKWSGYTDHNGKTISISVNFSRVHLTNAVLAQRLKAIVEKHNIKSSLIEIEITESAVFDDSQKLISIMGELRSLGFCVSIDDFGSGYSSLNTLKDMPTDVIKMDKGFLDEATDNEKAKLIISSLIQMTKTLGLATVAEGVETLEQVEFLKNAGCDIAQGYFYAKPMPVEEFEELFRCINSDEFIQ